MKLIHLTKIATIASLLVLSNISCAADPVKPAPAGQTNPAYGSATTQDPKEDRTETRMPIPAAGFKLSSDGRFIPVTKDGKEFVQCSGGKDFKNTCAIFNNKVTAREIKTTVITKIVYSVNPTCVTYCEDLGTGFPFCYRDPQDPNCAKFN